MRTHRKITLQQWHSLFVRRENKEAVMRLDGTGSYIGVRASGQMSKLDISTDFFLGGVPVLSAIDQAALKDVTSQRDFRGCIQSLKVTCLLTFVEVLFELLNYKFSISCGLGL